MAKPRMLDLFCGAGGAAMGYHRAGFEVVGVDLKPQPRYPFDFHQADALTFPLDGFDAIHASPPCQHYSEATRRQNRDNHPDLIATVRERLRASGIAWVIENVPGAPLRIDYRLCGCRFGLSVERERWFETSWEGFDLQPPCNRGRLVMNTLRSAHGPWYRLNGRVPTRAEIAVGMGVPWIQGEQVKQAIPPAYTEYIGRALLDVMGFCGCQAPLAGTERGASREAAGRGLRAAEQ